MTQNEKSKIRAKVIKWVTRLFLILVAIIMLYPLAWNVVSSFKTSTEFLTDPFAWPQGLAWDNYVRAYEKSNLAANIGNSIYVVLETLVIIVICVVPCSYCLVRYKFPGAKLILNIYMAAIFIQATYIMIPLFLQMNKLNLLNSLTALGVLYATMQFPFAIFLLTGFLRSIPRDYEEAAMIDGCGPFRILTSIIIPMCKPGIGFAVGGARAAALRVLRCANASAVVGTGQRRLRPAFKVYAFAMATALAAGKLITGLRHIALHGVGVDIHLIARKHIAAFEDAYIPLR